MAKEDITRGGRTCRSKMRSEAVRRVSYIFYASFIYLFCFLNRGMEILILRNTVAGLR